MSRLLWLALGFTSGFLYANWLRDSRPVHSLPVTERFDIFEED